MAELLSDEEFFGPSPSALLTDDQFFGEPAETPTAATRPRVFPEYPEGHLAGAPSAPAPRSETAAVSPSEKTVMGNVKEVGKGLVPGAVRGVGTTMKGLASVAGRPAGWDEFVAEIGRAETYTPEQITDFRSRMAQHEYPIYGMALDRFGEAQTPEERQAVVDRVKGLFIQRPVTERPVYKAGEAVSEFAEGLIPAAPGYEDSPGRLLGEGLGTLGLGLATSALTGPLGAAAMFSFMGSGEAVERAVQEGANEEQIIEAARLGLFPGMTDAIPVETLLGRVPVPGAKLLEKIPISQLGPALRAIKRVGWQVFIEGVQEGGQEFLQNLIAREVYKPNQSLTEGVPGAAALGGGVGGIAATVKETGSAALQAFAGGRRRRRIRSPASGLGRRIRCQRRPRAPRQRSRLPPMFPFSLRPWPEQPERADQQRHAPGSCRHPRGRSPALGHPARARRAEEGAPGPDHRRGGPSRRSAATSRSRIRTVRPSRARWTTCSRSRRTGAPSPVSAWSTIRAPPRSS